MLFICSSSLALSDLVNELPNHQHKSLEINKLKIY